MSDRLERLEEQRLFLPKPTIMEHLGVYYAVFEDEGELMFYEELLPDAFDGFDVVCFGGYMNAFELGSMH